jgi:simple sugar transport system ATP-binding protein
VLVRVRSVEKRFGDVHAVRGVSCSFSAGEIHAVCGENGAGKSTLLKLAAGMIVPDAGEVFVGPTKLEPHTPREAIRRGVAMVLQHFALVPVFTTLENIVLGAEIVGPLGILDRDRARTRALSIGEELGVTLPLDTRIEELGIGDRQRIEIARALFRDARLLILDEPTAVLTKSEAAALYATVRRLARAGKGIVVVTHKMDEVREHADVVTVMRRGELVFTRPVDRNGDVAAQVDEVTSAIMGASSSRERRPRAASDGAHEQGAEQPALLRMAGVSVGGALTDVDLTLREGEVVGVAGVEGNGQKELVAVLASDVAADKGKIDGGPIVVVREDRQTEGLVLDAPLRDNLVLGELARFTRRSGVLDGRAIEVEARQRLERSGANADLDRPARTLSGGNQQKIVVARALAREAKVLVLAQPTRGVDLSASDDIHARIRDAAKSGTAVLVISADLDELRKLASRIVVLARGRIVAELEAEEATDERLGRLMLGLGTATEVRP